MTATQTRQGIGVSPGSAHGPVVQVAPPVRPPADEPAATDTEAALAEVRAAFESVAVSLEGKARHADDTAQQILKATALIARDKGLVKAAAKQLAAGRGPAHAVEGAVEEYAAQFEALGGYFAERVTDLRDVGSRAVAAVLGVPAPGVPDFTEPSVVVAEDLAPAETATLDRSLVVGIITEAGGRTSHTAILAAQMGIPAVVQLPGATSIPPGTPVALDGDSGVVTVAPDVALVEAQRVRRERRAEALSATSGPGRTSDGPRWRCSRTSGVSRTPSQPAPTTSRGSACSAPSSSSSRPRRRRPSTSRQRSTARSSPRSATARRRAHPRRRRRQATRLRRPRAGGEPCPRPARAAPLGGASGAPRRPARGARHRGRDTGADVRVMAPMVATAEEAAWFARRVRENGLPQAGVMIEVPGAALRSRHVLADVDFGSLGTNDLAQYTMAADRMQGELSDLLDPWQPAVLDIAAAASEGARRAGRPLSVSAVSPPVTPCWRSCSSGSACRACRWRRPRCPSCASRSRCTPSSSARASPRWPARPRRPSRPSRRCVSGPVPS